MKLALMDLVLSPHQLEFLILHIHSMSRIHKMSSFRLMHYSLHLKKDFLFLHLSLILHLNTNSMCRLIRSLLSLKPFRQYNNLLLMKLALMDLVLSPHQLEFLILHIHSMSRIHKMSSFRLMHYSLHLKKDFLFLHLSLILHLNTNSMCRLIRSLLSLKPFRQYNNLLLMKLALMNLALSPHQLELQDFRNHSKTQ